MRSVCNNRKTKPKFGTFYKLTPGYECGISKASIKIVKAVKLDSEEERRERGNGVELADMGLRADHSWNTSRWDSGILRNASCRSYLQDEDGRSVKTIREGNEEERRGRDSRSDQ